MPEKTNSKSIAVIGLACWYPGAQNPRQLWENILARRRQFRQIPDQRLPLSEYWDPNPGTPDKTYGRLAAVIDGFDFKWADRRIPKTTFQATDIVHWLALEVALEAVGDAGYTRENVPGERTGVIIGNSLTGEQTRANTMRSRWPFVRRVLKTAFEARGRSFTKMADLEATVEACYKSAFPPIGADSLSGGLSNTIAGRICNYLNLGGGGYTVDGACSSSLLAVATAANGLAGGDLDLALAGGVDVSLDTFELVGFAKTSALTATDMTVYDRRGSGFIPGEGCGFVVLKRLDDALRDGDHVYAVVRGWGISSDGAGTGITAPSPKGQSKALMRAYERAGYDMRSLSFIEGHGTGTRAGDKAELEGIALAIGDAPVPPDRFCGVSSLKSIIGHTKAASGIAGFIKGVMAVNRRVIPPTANCREPHPVFDGTARSLYPVLHGQMLDAGDVMRAGVSGMGFGGINCHVTLESCGAPSPRLAPGLDERALMVSNQETELFVLTGESLSDLGRKIEDLRASVTGISFSEMVDLAAKKAQEADRRANLRCALVAGKPDELCTRLDELVTFIKKTPPEEGKVGCGPDRMFWLGNRVHKTRLGMLFPGQGSQKLNMARVLVERFVWARELVAAADSWVAEVGTPAVSSFTFRPTDRAVGPEQIDVWFQTLAQTEHAQPAICIASVLWLGFLQRLGIKPSAVGGHSLGELTAFFAAGAYGLADLIRLASVRGQGMAAPGDKAGAMVSVRCSREEAEAILERVTGYVVLANINGPRQVVLSGEREATEDAVKVAAEAGIQTRRLKEVSNAFHSRLASKAAEVLSDWWCLPEVLEHLDLRLFSSTDGREVKPGMALKDHFCRQVLAQVDFVSLVRSMGEECDLILEVGPGRVLSSLARDITGPSGPMCLPIESVAFNDKDLNTALAAVFVHGVDVHWETLFEGRLVRTFKAAADRRFVESPCERPLVLDGQTPIAVRTGTESSVANLLPEFVDLSEDELRTYLEKRGAFLADLIRTDLKHSMATLPAGEGMVVVTPAAPVVISPVEGETEKGVKETVIAELVKATGFQPESLEPESKLLDDLNLDSLKTGDLISAIATRLGLEGGVDSFAFVNLPIREVVERFEEMVGPRVSADEDEVQPNQAESGQGTKRTDVLTLVQEEVSRITGYPKASLDLDTEVEKGLGLSTEMIKELLDVCAERFKVSLNVDLEPLVSRSLRQIASIVERVMQGGPSGRDLPTDVGLPTWVRDYDMALVEQAAPPLPAWWGQRQEDDWQTSRVLVLSTPDGAEVADSLRTGLFRRGAQVRTATYFEAQQAGLIQDAGYSHLVAILPQSPGRVGPPAELLQEAVDRLGAVTRVPPASQAPRRRTTVAYVQFGGGYFGTQPQFAHINQCCATALAASLHLERKDLRVRVLDFSPTLDLDRISEAVLAEINTPDAYDAAGFDFEMTRRVFRPRLLQPARYTSRPLRFSESDVFLVTGGAKGITAACVLGLAKATKAQFVLVGSSPGPDPQTGRTGDPKIDVTLNAFRARGLKAAYYQCDVADQEAVRRLVAQVRDEVGAITGVVHGAGLNMPRPASRVSVKDALSEISPKVLGARYLMEALWESPPRLFVGLTSIIGLTGMPGNAWYGFSNEALDMLLREFDAAHPETQTLSVAYSIWKETGMGPRLDAVRTLGEMGIAAIPTEEGVRRFVRLCLNDPGVHQVVVTAQVGGLDTWKQEGAPAPAKARFLEKKVRSTPGVEAVFVAHLDAGKDPYLEHHLFDGTQLFPTVFGLEAMAQAVAAVSGVTDLERVRIEDVHLSRPIKVNARDGSDIIVRAEVQEQEGEGALRIVRAGVRQAGAGGSSDAFSATFVLGLDDGPPTEDLCLPAQALAIDPVLDLYRPNLLFQGPLFQQIDRIWALDPEEDRALEGRFRTRIQSSEAAAEAAFTEPEHRGLLLGDPFFRDTLLQSALLLVPRENALPAYVGRMEIYPLRETGYPMAANGLVRLIRVEGREIEESVVVVDPSGRVIERLEGYSLGILSHRNENPSVSELMAPDKRDTWIVQQAWRAICGVMNVEMPVLRLCYLGDLVKLPREERHRLELPYMQEVVAKVCETEGVSSQPFEIFWQESGKPAVAGLEGLQLDVSVSHDARLCIVVAGSFAQGCDVEPITSRTRADWTKLLGPRMDPLLETLLDRTDSLDQAGTRIWSALEVQRKITGENREPFEIVRTEGDAVLLAAKGAGGELLILTMPMALTWGPRRILAMAVRKLVAEVSNVVNESLKEYEPLQAPHAQLFRDAGPQGQPVMVQRFHVTFKPAAQLSRKVHYSNYLFWAGEVREASAWPVMGKIAEDFRTGKVGGVTNWARIRFFGEATTHDLVEVAMWASGNGGPKNSTMDLGFDFHRLLPHGQGIERLAWMEQRTTWVKVLEHGNVEPAEYPDYYWDFMKEMMPRTDAPVERRPLPEPLAQFHPQREEPVIFRAPDGPHACPIVYEHLIETTQSSANFVGNIYFAHYHVWLGEARDRFLFSVVPDHLRGMGDGGEVICLECRVDHLREAMPYDRILVTVGLKTLRTCGVRFYFECFRADPDGGRVYLACGEQEVVWVRRDDAGNPIPTPWPKRVMDALGRVLYPR